MALEPPSEEILAAIRQACEIDEETLIEAGKTIKMWLSNQPHLPNDFDEKVLQLFYLRCKKRMDKVHTTINSFYTCKEKIPEILADRDPCAPWFKQMSEIVYWFTLPQLTEDLCRVTITGLVDPDASKFQIVDVLKLDCVADEVRIPEEFSPFSTIIVNLEGCGITHYAQYTLSIMKKIKVLLMDRMPFRLKSLHLVNASTYVDISVSLIKILLKPKLLKRVHVHRHGLGTLHEYVSPKILPLEYGGQAGPTLEMWDKWKETIIQSRDFFITEEELKADEMKS